MKNEIVERVLDLVVKIQQIAAPTFAEGRRGAFVHERFRAEGLQDVTMDETGNIYACLPGQGRPHPMVVSAHLDTVFPVETDLRCTRSAERLTGPGIGDNSLGVAGLFGLVWAARARGITFPGDVWLVANVAEEGLGDLKGMRAVVDRFQGDPRGYIVLEGMALGQIYHRGLGVKRYRIEISTEGGHSWVDYGKPSAVHELAALVTRLTALPVPETPRTTLNVGVIRGGTTINTIAANASLELDLRSESSGTLSDLARAVERLVRSACRPGVNVSAAVIGRRPAGEIDANHPLVRLAARSLKAQGLQPSLGIGSTDANIPLSRGLPAICLGLTHGGGAHTLHEYIETAPVAQGLAHLLGVVSEAFKEL